MKRTLLFPPLITALVFTIPQALDNFQDPAASYVPVVYELLMLAFSYVAALLVNGVFLLPLNWLVIRFWSGKIWTGLVTGLAIALTCDIVAYAFEIFDYQPSIFHPAYLYTIFLPLLPLVCLNFWFLSRHLARLPVDDAREEASEEQGEDA